MRWLACGRMLLVHRPSEAKPRPGAVRCFAAAPLAARGVRCGARSVRASAELALARTASRCRELPALGAQTAGTRRLASRRSDPPPAAALLAAADGAPPGHRTRASWTVVVCADRCN